MTVNGGAIKRKDCGFSLPEEKLYKLECGDKTWGCDKKWGITSPVNQDDSHNYQKCLMIPVEGKVESVPIHDIFYNEDCVIERFSQIIHYRNKHKLDPSTSDLLLRSEARIVQLTKERFGPQAEKYLLQLSKRIDLKFRYNLSSTFPTQLGVNDSFRVIKNGAWFLCSYSEVFKSEEALKEYIKDLLKYIERTPKEVEKERAQASLKSLLERFSNMKESDAKERIVDFVSDFHRN